MMTIGHLIDGEPRDAAAITLTIINPATGEPLAEVAEGTADDIDTAVAAAQAAFPLGRACLTLKGAPSCAGSLTSSTS